MNHTPLLLLLLSAFAAARDSCPSGFHLVGSQCYRFSQEFSDTRSWQQARSYCQFLGADLAVLDLDCEDNHHLMYHIISNGYSNNWIGASDMATEGVWRWIDNRIVEMTSPLWYYNEPDNPSSNDCALIVGSTGDFPRAHIFDHVCSDALNYICQTGIHTKQ